MALATGTRLGPYEIVSPLGAGGMGEVYRAADMRLKRQVAIKIMPAELAVDAARLARFQREAEVLASLNHPHIGAIYGIEESNGLRALVMELVDGPTLEDRIARGALPVDEAIAIAKQIADALEAAHEQGIVHRDLKPANIKVRDDGAVKVLDFGLAKARDPGGESSSIDATVNIANSPTLASPAAMLSRDGVILGTAAYMSPEQARGRAVDKRTDVWAFGAVLYEMLTGRRAFDGDDITELLAAVVKDTPDWTALPPDLPPPVVTLIQRCLDKDRKTRIGDIAVARFLLSGDAAIATTERAKSPVAATPWRQAVPWVAGAAVVGVVIGWALPHKPNVALPLMHLQTDFAPADGLASSNNSGPRPARIAVTLTPDGRRLAFAGTRGSVTQLYVRDLDRADAVAIAGTDNAGAPFLSPDGAWIGFVADNKIKKVSIGGGPASVVCDLPTPTFWGASWGADGNVYYAVRAGLFKVPSDGGTPAQVTKLDLTKNDRHLLPQLLPGGSSLLFTAPPNLVIRSLTSGDEQTVVENASDGRYVSTGHLLFMRNGTLMAVPFDVRAGKTTGPAVALVENVVHAVNAANAGDETQAGQFAVSESGTLIYLTGGVFPSRLTTMAWLDRTGSSQPLPGATPRRFLVPRLSPDGQKIAVQIRGDDRQDDVWIYDAVRGTPTRLTFDGGFRPVWSPDGKQVLYVHGSSGGATNLYAINADGSGKPERLTSGDTGQTAASWSAGTNTISLLQRPTTETFGIYLLPMSNVAGRKPSLLLESRFAMTHAELSPDGHWIAYVSTESGTTEVYVQAVAEGRDKTRISTDGGFEPLWMANGREILYRSGPTLNRFYSVTIGSLSPLRVDAPRLLFETKPGEFDATTPLRAWDAAANGQRFIAMRASESNAVRVTTVNVVLNWTEELKRRVPALR